ncbi:capsid assembly protein [Caballeronia sp. LZ032]|uniref:capsid assembly protein n=1 Tax=Caballeronia sp. LZ032 TaxID=3038565 RepID=UPI002859CD55|nr:hypothetical protein [Caballeronia sp. LZ032]MDR5879024.1 hypothetical protein [Caballeronia sp. LZ032]
MTTEATTPTTPTTPVTPEAAPLIPDSPEYRAAMIAKAEGQSGTPTPVAPTETTKTEGAKPTEAPADKPDPNAPAPKLTDDSAAPKDGADKPAEKTDEGKDVPAFDFAKAFEDGTIVDAFNAEKPDAALTGALAKALGVGGEQVEQMLSQFRAGQVALQTQATQGLYEAAGGQAQFNELIQWGQANLTPQQREYYDGQLNGPHAKDAIELLVSKMNAGKDPSLININGRTTPTISGYRDQSEMVAAMADPRYNSSQAYRDEVTARVARSAF